MPIVIQDDPRIERTARQRGYETAQEFLEAVVEDLVVAAPPEQSDAGRADRLAAWERLRGMARPLSDHVDDRRESFYPDANR